MTSAGAIDVHAHFLPERYRQALVVAGHEEPDGFHAIPEWSPVDHLALMDRLGIGTALLSVSSPGVHLGGGVSTVDLARTVNEEGHRAVVDHPGRFGLLASLPLPDVDAALVELAHAADHLDADGFVLLTNVAGTYVGDPAWDPVLAELDRRGARVLLHPTSPACWEATSLGRPRPMLEFLFDTTRAVVDLVLSGALARYPNVRVIIPHAGAVLPLVADRIAAFGRRLAPDVDVHAALRSLHFDLAGYPLPRQLPVLRTIADPAHLHYGSDWPFTPDVAVEAAIGRLRDEGDLIEALRANTERLFPRSA